MTDLITAEEAQKLLEGTTPGPWELDGVRPHTAHVWPVGGSDDPITGEIDIDNAHLIAAAPDLARTVIALHAQLADAQAATAAVVERCADKARECWADGVPPPEYEEHIRALAPASGLALVRELRADADRLNRWRAEEGEKIKRQAKALTGLTKHCQRIEAENAGLARKIGKVQRGDGDHSQIADLEAKVINQRNELANLRARDGRLAELAVERDRLADANAVLEAKAAGLRDFIDEFAKAKIDALRYSPPCGSSPEDEPDPVVDAETVWAWQADAKAALATQEAGTC